MNNTLFDQLFEKHKQVLEFTDWLKEEIDKDYTVSTYQTQQAFKHVLEKVKEIGLIK